MALKNWFDNWDPRNERLNELTIAVFFGGAAALGVLISWLWIAHNDGLFIGLCVAFVINLLLLLPSFGRGKKR
jgi:hypothetical protein